MEQIHVGFRSRGDLISLPQECVGETKDSHISVSLSWFIFQLQVVFLFFFFFFDNVCYALRSF